MPILFNEQVLQGTVNAASVSYSTLVPDTSAYTFQVGYTATGSLGLIKLQASFDNQTWVDIDGSTVQIRNETGNKIFDVVEQNYKYVQLVCTSTTGNITFSAKLTIKRASAIA